MPQNVLVSVLGEGKYLTALVRAIFRRAFCFCLQKMRPLFRLQRAMT